MATELGGAAFAKDVASVNSLLLTWIAQYLPFLLVTYGTLDGSEMTSMARDIDPSEWKHAIDDCLIQPVRDSEAVYLLDYSGLHVTNKLVSHFRSQPTAAVHFLAMMAHAYLFSVSSYKMQNVAGLRSSLCLDYLRTTAPYAMTTLYTVWLVSTDQVEMARHMHRMYLKASKSLFKWEPKYVNEYALERMESVKVLFAIPEDLYSPLAMDKHYSYLPVVQAPAVKSLMQALRARADYDLFSYEMIRYAGPNASATVASRWRLRQGRAIAKGESAFMDVNAIFIPFYNLAMVPPAVLSDPFMDADDVITSYARAGDLISHEIMHAFDR